MTAAKVSTKGQLVVPPELRGICNWSAGMTIAFVAEGDGVKTKPVLAKKRDTIDDLSGILPCSGPPKTLDVMQPGVDVAMAERRARTSI